MKIRPCDRTLTETKCIVQDLHDNLVLEFHHGLYLSDETDPSLLGIQSDQFECYEAIKRGMLGEVDRALSAAIELSDRRVSRHQDLTVHIVTIGPSSMNIRALRCGIMP